MGIYDQQLDTNRTDVYDTHFCGDVDGGSESVEGNGRPPIDGITRRSGNTEETFGTDGSYAWSSADGHSVELYADGGFRIEDANGSVFEREPGGELQERTVAGGRSDFRDDADGTFHWTDGRGNFVEVDTSGEAIFAREDGSLRHSIPASGGGLPDRGNTVLDSNSAGFTAGGTMSFPMNGAPPTDGSVVSTETFDGGFEMTDGGGSAVRLTDDGKYQWTDGEGNFLAVDGGTVSMRSANGDWRTYAADGSIAGEGNAYRHEPSTSWPDYDQIIGEADGAQTITNPSGSVVSTNREGDVDIQSENGGSVYRDAESGEVATITRDGAWTLIDPDGQNLYGHLAIDGPPPVGRDAFADGAGLPTGTETEELGSGQTITYFPNGAEYLRSPDGTTEWHDSDGNHVVTDPDGNISWYGPNIRSGKSTVEEVVAGSLLRTDGLPDGTDRATAREFNLTGEVVSGSGGGGESVTTYEGGGTITVDRDNDRIKLEDGSGRYRVLDGRTGEIIDEGSMGVDSWLSFGSGSLDGNYGY